MGLPYSSDGEETACNSGGPDLIPGSERSHEEGNDNLLQYSCLKNPMDRGAWWASLWGPKELDITKRLTHSHCTLKSRYFVIEEDKIFEPVLSCFARLHLCSWAQSAYNICH